MAVAFDKKDDHVVVVIGSGAGGGTLCHELTATGIDVVCIEAGAPLNDIVPDSAAMFPRLTWLDRRIGSGDMPPDFPVWSGKNVGGTTLHWTATALRFPDEQFAATRYLGGLEDCSVIDWPVTADEMRPWYARAEQSMGVSGTNDWPHLPDSNNYRVLKEGARRIGLTGEKSTMAINSVARDGRPACQQIGFCVSGCPTNAKWTAANTPIAKALETSHFELRDRSFVLRVEHDDADRVNSVVYVDENGDIQRQSARVVCMAANSIDTARILLNSESSAFPNGLANKSGNVGRHYVKHTFSIITALLPHPVRFNRGTDNLGRVIDFIPSDANRGFVGGFKFEQVSFDPAALVNLSRPGAWGADYASQLEKYDHYSGLLVMGEDPSQPDNRVTLHPTEKDQYGMPVPIVHYVHHENSNRMLAMANQKAEELFESLGSEGVFLGPLPPATHNMGTCRMASSIDDGVCDKWGRTFDVPNLFVSDGSQFSSSGTSNPTLTIVALAMRQADYLRKQMAEKAL